MAILPKLGRAIYVLLGGILFTHLGSYMLLPFFAIILSTEKGLSLGATGLVLGAGSIAFLTGSLLGGFLSDRFGRRMTMVSGLLIRGAGLLGFIWGASFSSLFLTNLVAGVGGGIYAPGAKAGIAALASQGTKTTAFSYRGVAANIGVTMGPLLGTYLHTKSSTLLFGGSAVVYFVLALSHLLLLERDCRGEDCPKVDRQGIKQILTDRPFLYFSVVTIFVWALFTQFALSLPLRAAQIDSARNIGLLFTASAVLVILLQGTVTRFFTKHLHPLGTMAIGILLIGTGLGSVALSTSFWHLVASAVVVTFGQMFVMPTSDAIVADLAKPEQIGSYFGVAAFVFGAGEALGNIAGGQLMELAVAIDYLALPWLLYGAVGLLLGGTYYLLRLWQPLARPLAPVTEERTEHNTGRWRPKQKT
ncbi:putative MFS family arabinose efflux permease [Tumebacillus sp. BK434]|uniref:MDR family MFS transporter n=1 Tax=Tumebacillus sp. BK434 TaxID=2512169 RepID=UPI0010430017|nr:MFS transporter [Tumebacillus sp. BK434]TCP55524.1 putative MFS family arabinose efflux permease [Tumebacillus sp. BK434]